MNKIKKFFFKRIEIVKLAFKKFPITIILIFILTFICTFIDELFSNVIFEHIGFIIVFMILGTAFSEIALKGKIKYIGIISSFLVGAFFDRAYELKFLQELTIIRWATLYAILCIFVSLYLLSKSNGNFEKYILNTFLNVERNVIIYGIVCIGVSTLYGIFCVLIRSLDFDVILKFFMLFTGVYLAPAILNSFTDEKVEDSKFNKTLFTKVFFVLLCLAMIIVYIYIFKLLFITGMPKNEVFMILSGIFVFLLPICIINKNYCNEDKFLRGAIKTILALFIPFIVLQMYTMGIRIFDYGITEMRYFSIIFMLFEMISIAIVLYKDSKYLKELLLVVCIIFIIGLVSPINFQKISLLSQENIVKKFVNSNKSFDSLEIKEQRKFAGAYQYLEDIKDYELEIQIDILEKEKLESFSNFYDRTYEYYNEDSEFMRQIYHADLEDLDISEYSKIEDVRAYASNYYKGKTNKEFLNVGIEIDNNTKEITVDLNELANKLIEDYKVSKNTAERTFKEKNLLKIDSCKDLYITELALNCYKETGEVESLSLAGYVVEK